MSAKSGRRKSGYVPYSRGKGKGEEKSVNLQCRSREPTDLAFFIRCLYTYDEVLLQHNNMAAPTLTVRAMSDCTAG